MTISTSSTWGLRALHHAQELARTGRGSATQAEAQAAEYVRQQLIPLGISSVHVQPFIGLRSINLFIGLAFGFTLIGHAAYWLLRQPFGILPATVLSIFSFAFSGFLLWRKFTFQDYPLRTSLPHGPSQNVIAVLPPAGEVQQRVVLVAHLDSHRAVWWYASDLLVAIYIVLSPIAIGGVVISPVLYILAALFQQPVLAWIGLIWVAIHFIGWFTGVTADLGLYSPGANDNASAVGTVLALAERIRQTSLQHTEVWLAFTGCEETGADGMRVLLDEYGETLKKALFLDYEVVGIGEQLVYMQNEGIARRKRIPVEIEHLIQDAGKEFGIKPLGIAGLGALTEIGVVLERGYRGVCILARRARSPLIPEWHRLSDTANRLEPVALEHAHDLGWEVLQIVDKHS